MNDKEALEQISLTNQRINDVVNDFMLLTEARIAYSNSQLVKYIDLIYLRAIHNYILALFHHSPQFLDLLKGIWNFIKAIYEVIVWVVDIIRLNEILQVIKVLEVVWPAFREKMYEIYGKISEFSTQIGWGADGIAHLLNAAKAGINILGGVLGKDEGWLELKGADYVIKVMGRIAEKTLEISQNPSAVLGLLFKERSDETFEETKNWWDKTMAWIGTVSDKAVSAVEKADNLILQVYNITEHLPQFILDHIPQTLFDNIAWLDSMIDDNIMPKLTDLSNTMEIVNAQIDAQRQKAAELAEKLAHPGDILNVLNALEESEKKKQEEMLDEAVSGQLVRDNESDEIDLKPVWEGFRILLDALSEPPPTPTYLAIEDRPAPVIRFPDAVVYGSWDIYDFVA